MIGVCGFFKIFAITLSSCVLFKLIERFLRSFYIKDRTKKHVLITGCDSGPGYLLAKKLDTQGVFVIGTCATEEGVDRLQNECSSRLKAVNLDLSKEDDIEDFSEYLKSELDGIGLHALVNNELANETVYTDFDNLNIDDYKKVFEGHILAVANMSSKFLPLLIKGRGRIVNVTSTAGRLIKPTSHSVPSCMSLAATEALSDCYRIVMKLHRQPVSVHVIEPGDFRLEDLEKKKEKYEAGFKRLTKAEFKKQEEEDKINLIGRIQFIINEQASDRLDMIVDAYEHAIFAKWPKKRYSINNKLNILLSYFPSFISDYLIINQYRKFYNKAKKGKGSGIFDINSTSKN
ncbi:DgyrCDS4898 [Dimorphilus gyrociliatus]|uniref:DgyrCDS4898 n=1 Tax=Dimorphilus gyrociliatus TaxID=2664684 RepID=A0A7I8VN18_9ANNE|nr:DgyrCDS4898 [Dimorphilus gyrociliatus]